MFGKSNFETTFNFENDWGHFYYLDDNNINNINNVKFYNNLYKHAKKKIEIPKTIKKIEIPETVEEIEIPETIEEKKIEIVENYDIKKYVIDSVFSCVSVMFITFVSFKVHYFTNNI